MRSWPLLQTSTLLILTVACIGMAGVIYAELTAPVLGTDDAAPAPRAAGGNPRGTGAAQRFSLPPLPAFAAVTERPLFAQSRRGPAHGSDESLGPWTSLALAGIVITASTREALILHGRPQVMVHLQEGQSVEGWVVTSILPDRVVMRGGSTENELRLLDKPPAPNPPAGASPQRRPFNP